ncbi:MAG: FUSC family protein [Xylophilus ampelinus]
MQAAATRFREILDRRLGLDRAGLGHALQLGLSAWLAFALASLLHVQNAYWAAMPVWVVAQASRGLLLERAAYRVLGTLVGAAGGFAILQAAPQHPYLQVALLSAWVGAGAALTHLLPGVRAYGALLAGMTAAVVVLPSVLAPGHAGALAVARVECTLIGVAVVTLVTGLFTPAARRDDFYRRACALAGDAVAFAAGALREAEAAASARPAAGGQPPAPAAASDALERRILADLGALEAAALPLAAGSAEGYRRLRHVQALVVSSLAAMAAARALRARAWRGLPAPGGLADALERRAARLRQGVVPPPAAGAADPRDARPPGIAPAAGGPASASAPGPAAAPAALPSPLERLRAALDGIAAAEAALFGDAPPARAAGPGPLAPHRDPVQARRTGLLSGGATFAAACAGIASGWAPGELAALGVCIFSMVLGSLPTPRRIVPTMAAGVLAGVAAATLYRFLVQPQVDGLPGLLLSLAPFIAAGALARASRRTALPALDANMCFMLASQAGMPAAGASAILQGGAALLLAAGAVSALFLALPRREDKQLAEAVGAIRQDLRRMVAAPGDAAAGRAAADWQARGSRQILRLMVHLGRAGQLGDRVPRGILAALNLGHALDRLRAAGRRPDLDPAHREALDEAAGLLRGFAGAPERVRLAALRLRALADGLDGGPGGPASAAEGAAAPALRDAADALDGGAELFAWAPPGRG